MMNWILRMTVLTVVLLAVAACGNQAGNDDRDMEGYRLQTNNITNQAEDNNLRTNQNQNQNQNRNATMHNNSRVEMSEEIAERIANMNEIDTANVMLTDENAYIAVVLNDDRNENRNNTMNRNNNFTNGNNNMNRNNNNRVQNNNNVDVTDNLKERIAILVQSRNPDIDNVYVSTNPDFVDRMNGFVDQVQAGNPVSGFINEFNTMVNRMFPNNAADR